MYIQTITRRDGEVSYKTVIKQSGRTIATKTFRKKTNATKWGRRIESDEELLKALGSKAAGVKFSTLADQYLKWWSAQNKKDKAVSSKVKWWVARLGDLKVVEITDEEIEKHLDEYAAGKAERGNGVDERGHSKTAVTTRPRSAGTVNRMKAQLSAIYKFGREHARPKIKVKNPVADVAGRTEPAGIVRWLSDDERDSLLKAVDTAEWPKLGLLVRMGLMTGARLGELLSLSWSDIDFEGRTAHLSDTKNSNPRRLTLPPPVMTELDRFREVGGHLIFPSVKRPGRPFEFRPHWNKALKDAGIENFRFHDLRHSAASYLAMADVPLQTIADVLGHKTLAVTMRYIHLSTGHKQKVTDKVLGGLFSE